MHLRLKPSESIDSDELRKWIVGAGGTWPATPLWVIKVDHQTGVVEINEEVLSAQQSMIFEAILRAHPDWLETLQKGRGTGTF